MDPKTDLRELESRGPGFRSALELCLAKIKHRDHFEEELRELLVSKGHPPETAGLVLKFLSDRGFISNQRTLINHISRRSGRQGYGQEKIRAELLGRGAPEELVDECLEAHFGGDSELEAAIQALRRKYRERPSVAQAGRFLMSRGFSEELVESALGRYFELDDLSE